MSRDTLTSKPLLPRAIAEIMEVINRMPRLSQRLSWRMHPDDMMAISNEIRLQQLAQTDGLYAWGPECLHICGIRVFEDEKAERL